MKISKLRSKNIVSIDCVSILHCHRVKNSKSQTRGILRLCIHSWNSPKFSHFRVYLLFLEHANAIYFTGFSTVIPLKEIFYHYPLNLTLMSVHSLEYLTRYSNAFLLYLLSNAFILPNTFACKILVDLGLYSLLQSPIDVLNI